MIAIATNLANALVQAGWLKEAEQHYREAVRMAPGNAVVHNNMAVILFKRGSREETIAEFRKALAIDPSLRDAREGLEIAERGETAGDTADGQ